ncbi:MAG: universal stress protein, partial [Gammaproteobacteria bacterium]
AKGADVIVVGSHGRHGLALLLGSTANGVLHGATCDVLAVRVGEQPTQDEPEGDSG